MRLRPCREASGRNGVQEERNRERAPRTRGWQLEEGHSAPQTAARPTSGARSGVTLLTEATALVTLTIVAAGEH